MRREARRTAMRREASGDEGSILPLVIGYAVLAIAIVLVCANATSLHLAQKRLDGLADAAALAGADGFALSVEGDAVRARLDDPAVREQAQALVDASPLEAVLVHAAAPDGLSARVTVAMTWHPVLVSAFVPGGVEISATATSRTALR